MPTYSAKTYAARPDPLAWALQAAFSLKVATGTLYAIRPAVINSAIPDDSFGYHVVGIPDGPITGSGVYFVGSGILPANPANGAFPQPMPLTDMMGAGVFVISPAYNNINSIGTTCGTNGACYGPARLDVLQGGSAFITVSTANAGLTRCQDLINRIKALAPRLLLPAGFSGANIDWSKVIVSGHSQGGGMALMTAKLYNVLACACFSAPTDNSNNISPEWITANGSDFLTPMSKIRGVMHYQDAIATGGGTDNVAIPANFATLGIVESTLSVTTGTETVFNNGWVRILIDVITAGGTNTTPHNFTVYNTLAKNSRLWAMRLL